MAVRYNIKHFKKYHERESIENSKSDDADKTKERVGSKRIIETHNIGEDKRMRVESNIDNDDVIISGVEKEEMKMFAPVDRKWQKSVSGTFRIAKAHTVVEDKVLSTPKTVQAIKGDGNCFFRSVSFAITGTQLHHRTVRDNVVTYMNAHAEKIQNHYGHNYLESSNMSENAEWATEAELFAAAAYLETDIQVYTKSGTKMKWLNYSRSVLGNSEKGSEKCIYLQNTSGVHFEYVCDVY